MTNLAKAGFDFGFVGRLGFRVWGLGFCGFGGFRVLGSSVLGLFGVLGYVVGFRVYSLASRFWVCCCEGLVG